MGGRARNVQNLIKRNSGPNRRSGMEGKTLAEKLAQSERTRDTDQDETEAVTEAKARRCRAARRLRPSRVLPTPTPSSPPPRRLRDRYAGREGPCGGGQDLPDRRR